MAIKKLKVLGNGFSVIPMGGRHLVQAVPGELTMDHTTLLQHAEVCTLSQTKLLDRLYTKCKAEILGT